jgi:hypothetical protein
MKIGEARSPAFALFTNRSVRDFRMPLAQSSDLPLTEAAHRTVSKMLFAALFGQGGNGRKQGGNTAPAATR